MQKFSEIDFLPEHITAVNGLCSEALGGAVIKKNWRTGVKLVGGVLACVLRVLRVACSQKAKSTAVQLKNGASRK